MVRWCHGEVQTLGSTLMLNKKIHREYGGNGIGFSLCINSLMNSSHLRNCSLNGYKDLKKSICHMPEQMQSQREQGLMYVCYFCRHVYFTHTYHVHGGNPTCFLCQINIQDAATMLLITMLLFEKPKRKYGSSTSPSPGI